MIAGIPLELQTVTFVYHCKSCDTKHRAFERNFLVGEGVEYEVFKCPTCDNNIASKPLRCLEVSGGIPTRINFHVSLGDWGG